MILISINITTFASSFLHMLVLHTSETIIMNSMCSLQTYSWSNITVIYQNVLKLYIYIMCRYRHDFFSFITVIDICDLIVTNIICLINNYNTNTNTH